MTTEAIEDGRIKALREKHEALDQAVMNMEMRPGYCSTKLRELKVKKLRCKDEIERRTQQLEETK